MPDPNRLLNTIFRATDLFSNDRGRIGHLLNVTEFQDILIAGDLHGNLGNFQAILKLADLDNHPARMLVLQEVIHGEFTYPTGGDKSHQLLDLIAALKCKYAQRIQLIPGNHEFAQVTDRLIQKHNRDLNEDFVLGVRMAYGEHAEEICAAYEKFIRALPLAIRSENRVFLSHSLPSGRRFDEFNVEVIQQDQLDDEEYVPGGSVFALVWGRDTSQVNVEHYLETVDADWLISGHIVCEDGYAVPNDRQIILDSMASPAACCLFPCAEPITQAELIECIQFLR